MEHVHAKTGANVKMVQIKIYRALPKTEDNQKMAQNETYRVHVLYVAYSALPMS